MKLAWEQVGEVLAANRRAAFLRFAQAAAQKAFAQERGAAAARPRRLRSPSPVFARVLGSPKTIRGLVAESRLPAASASPAFRKLTRPRGAGDEARAAGGSSAAALRAGSAIGDQRRRASPRRRRRP